MVSCSFRMSSISRNEVAGEISLISYFFSSPSEPGEDWRQILSLKFIVYPVMRAHL